MDGRIIFKLILSKYVSYVTVTKSHLAMDRNRVSSLVNTEMHIPGL